MHCTDGHTWGWHAFVIKFWSVQDLSPLNSQVEQTKISSDNFLLRNYKPVELNKDLMKYNRK